MKVGIITLFYKTYNYGAQLQAYALQKVIEKLGFECEQIRYRWSYFKTEVYYMNCNVNQEKFEKFAASIPHSKKIYTPENIQEASLEYDCFVCGSDQIWGVKDSMPPYVLPHMALSFVPKEKSKIAYAASFGSAVLDAQVGEIIKKPLNHLDAISIREGSGKESLQKYTSKEVETVIDPTMLLDIEKWNHVAEEPDIKEDYIFVYNISNSEEIDNFAQKFAQSLSVKVIKIGYDKGNAVGPEEFIGYIKKAEFVITDSFHGTVFSILYHKRFVTYIVDKADERCLKNARINDLLNLFGLEEHYVHGTYFKIIEILLKEINYKRVDEILELWRKKSINFLDKNLSRKVEVKQCSEKEFIKKQGKLNYVNKSIRTEIYDYLYCMLDASSIERIAVEKKYLEMMCENEELRRTLYVEMKKMEIMDKIRENPDFLINNPKIYGGIFIYGAGKVGKMVAELTKSDFKGYIDSNLKLKNVNGHKVYHMDFYLADIMKNEMSTVIVTPFMDYYEIKENLESLVNGVNVLSIESII